MVRDRVDERVLVETWREYKESGSLEARDFLFNVYYPKLVKIPAEIVAHRLSNTKDIDVDDLAQEGGIAMLEEMERYDLSRGVKFGSFAGYRIFGAMKDLMRKVGFYSSRAYHKLRNAGQLPSFESLPASEFSEEWSSILPGDVECLSYVESILKIEEEDTNRFLFRGLTEQEEFVLRAYYFDGLIERKIGLEMNLSESRICQIKRAVLDRLRERFFDGNGGAERLELLLSA